MAEQKPGMDAIDLAAEREARGADMGGKSLRGNCARSTYAAGSVNDQNDNPWGDYATRLLEESR